MTELGLGRWWPVPVIPGGTAALSLFGAQHAMSVDTIRHEQAWLRREHNASGRAGRP